MTDLKNICPDCTLGTDKITVSESDVLDILLKWEKVDKKYEEERILKSRSWEKIKDRIVK